jgi:hypothetical protein
MDLPKWEHVPRAFHRDKTNPANHARYSILHNPVTGKNIVVDGYEKRYNLMRGRILAWANQMKKLEGEAFYKMIGLTYDTKGTKIEAVSWTPNDIRNFEVALRAWLKKNYPAILIYGFAWVGEVQPISKNYHYHLVIVSSKKLHFARGAIERLWRKGFVKVTASRSPFYLVAYTKKRDQKDYFYFPWGARGFSVWVAPWATKDGQKLAVMLRYHSLKHWQLDYLAKNSKGDDLEKDFEVLKGLAPPPSGWEWKGSFVKLELAEAKIEELSGGNRKDDLYRANQVEVEFLTAGEMRRRQLSMGGFPLDLAS